MRRALSPAPIAIVCVLLALIALLAYGLAQNEPDRGVDEVAYPETFVIDRQGRIAAVARGPVDDAFMRRNVAPLLERS